MDGREDTLGRHMAEGYRAHWKGQLMAECPYLPSHLRRLWRAGWMEREESYVRVALQRRRAGVL